MGASFSGRTLVSKTNDVGSIPTAPAKQKIAGRRQQAPARLGFKIEFFTFAREAGTKAPVSFS